MIEIQRLFETVDEFHGISSSTTAIEGKNTIKADLLSTIVCVFMKINYYNVQ